MAVTVGIYFDNRLAKDGEFYVTYLVYHDGKQRLFSTGYKLGSDDVAFLKKYKSGLTGGVREPYRRNLWNMIYGSTYTDDLSGEQKVSILRMAEELIGQMGVAFSFESFKAKIKTADNSIRTVSLGVENDVLNDLKEKEKSLKKDERLTDANLCTSVCQSLKRFSGKKSLKYSDITVPFLKNYEKWMLIEGKAIKRKDGVVTKPASITTVGIYARYIRSLFNEQIKASKVPTSLYPFGDQGYIIPSGLNIKKALSKEDITKIIQFKTQEGNLMELSRDLWVFSYLCNGINFADLLELKWRDADRKNDMITFVRQKTSERKKSKQNKVQIDMFPLTWTIVDRWGTKSNKSYIFPFFSDTMDAVEKKKVKNQVIKNTNKWMKVIAAELEISADVNTYSARHSFATILLQSEAPLAFISQKLDHASILTTQKYLGSFEDKQVKKYLNALLPDTAETS